MNPMKNRKKTKKLVFGFVGTMAIVFGLHSCKENKSEKVEEDTVQVVDDSEGFTQIFDGKTLDGWEGDPTYWSVKNGNLTGEVTPETLLDKNTFIIWQGGQPEDFELKLEVKIAEAGNSGKIIIVFPVSFGLADRVSDPIFGTLVPKSARNDIGYLVVVHIEYPDRFIAFGGNFFLGEAKRWRIVFHLNTTRLA